jgi:membrane protein
VLRAKFRRFLLKFFIRLRYIELPFFRGIGLYDILRFFIHGLTDSKFTLMAAAMAYNFFFSLIPVLILLFTLLPYIPIQDLQLRIMEYLSQFVPEQGMILLDGIIRDSFQKMGVGVISLNIFLALRVSTLGIIAMIKAFSKDEEVFRKRNILQLNWIALQILTILFVLFALAIGALIGGEFVLDYFSSHEIIGEGLDLFLLKVLNYGISLGLIFISVSFIYYLGPPTHERWKFFTPGAVIASLLILLAIFGLGYFFSNFANYNRIYGSLAAIIILMVWFYWISMMLLIGFELNAAIDLASYHRKGFRVEKKK